MDELFAKEKTLCDISLKEEFHMVFVRSLEKVQSRKICDLFLEQVEKDTLEIAEVFLFLQKLLEVSSRLNRYSFERLKKKFDSLRLLKYFLSTPLQLGHQEERSLCEFIDVFGIRYSEKCRLSPSHEVVQTRVMLYLGKVSNQPEIEIETALAFVKIIKSRRNKGKQEYLEEIVDLVRREIKNTGFVEEIMEEIKTDWPYDTKNPAQKVLQALVGVEACIYENFKARKISIHNISPFFIQGKETVHLMPVLFCIERVLEEEKDNITERLGDPATKFIECTQSECRQEIHKDHFKHYFMHRLRIDAEVEKLTKEILMSHIKDTTLIGKGAMHLKRYQKSEYLVYVVNCLKKAGRKKTPCDTKETKGLFSALKYFPMSGKNEDYILSISKAACEEEAISKIVLVLNILYSVHGTMKIGFAIGLVTHTLLKKSRASKYIDNIIYATGKKKAVCLKHAKELILDHFMYRSQDDLSVGLETLAKLYRYPSVKTFLGQEKYEVAPRMWQKEVLDRYYSDVSSISIYYAMYVYKKTKSRATKEAMVAQVKETICGVSAEGVASIYIAFKHPEDMFRMCEIDICEFIQRFSLMSLLFAARKVLEERVVPRENCVFYLMRFIVQSFYSTRNPNINELQEILLFLVHTGNLEDGVKCCRTDCSKECFFDELIRKSSCCDLIHYKYMISHCLSKEQKKAIEIIAGEDVSLYLEDASTLEEAVIRIYPYLKLRTFFVFISIRRILPTILESPQNDMYEVRRTHWPQLKTLIAALCRMYIDSREEGSLKALSYFGLLAIDMLEEEPEKTEVFLDKHVGLFDLEHRTKKEAVKFFITSILIPIYYETLDDLLLFIIQELLKDHAVDVLPEHEEFIARMKYSKYIIQIDSSRLLEIERRQEKSAYRRGISHISFLEGMIGVLARSPRKESVFPVLRHTYAILDTLSEKKWLDRHKVSLLQFYLFLMIYSLKPLNVEEIRSEFSPIFKDVKDGALINLDILRTIISNSLCMEGVFSAEDLLLCSNYLQDRHFTIRLLEEQLRNTASLSEKDCLLTRIQKECLKIKEKDAIFGINAVIQKLSPVNLAAELKINNENANYTYLNREILRQAPLPEKMDIKYSDLFESLKNIEEDIQDVSVNKILVKAEQAIQQWTHTVPLDNFSKDPDLLKTFLIDAHIIQDCQIIRNNSLLKSLDIIRDRREAARTYESLRVAEIHRHLFVLLPPIPEVESAEKDALLHGVRVARKSGQCELSEKLLIRSILKDDWRVFYEKAKIHLLKNNKSLAKQALQRLMLHLPKESQYRQKAILLNTEIEKSEEIYKIALSSLKANERLYFNYGKHIEKKHPAIAFKMFCKVLECGDTKAPEIVPKLIHYITDTTSRDSLKEQVSECVAEMHRTLQNTDIKIFRRCYMQILTRLSHKNKPVEELLSRISLRLIEEFPAEFSWRTLSLFKNKKNTAIHSLIEKTSFFFRKLFSDVIDFTEILGRISMHTASSGTIHIPSILGSSLAISRGIPAPCDDFTSEIVSVSDAVFVFATLQKPKKIQTLTSTGAYRSFLCKANDDLRKDAVFMDLNVLLNSLFQSDNECRTYSIRVYTVIPITEKMGIIEFVENLHTLKQICDDLYREKDISIKEIGISMGFVKKIKTLGKSLKELLDRVPPVFSRYFLRQFVHPIEWLQARKRYTITYAVMNSVGYLMGLGDRHCENILFDSKTGETVHVDLNCIFDKGLLLAVPETIPFRLTQNIIDAFGPTKEEGCYKLTLERVLKFLSRNRDLIVANLLGFVHDPLGEWTGRNNTKTAIQVIEKIKLKIDFDDEITKSTLLIEKSTSLEALGQMYVWWLPFI